VNTVIVIGVLIGATLAQASVGVVMLYRTTGVFNFAYGALAMISAYVFYTGRDEGQPWLLAMALAVAVTLTIGVLFGLILVKQERQSTLGLQVAATLGLMIFLQGAAAVRWGGEQQFAPILFSRSTLEILGVFVQRDVLFAAAVSVVSTGGFVYFLSATRAGLFLRAHVDNQEMTTILGVPVRNRVVLAWGLASLSAAIAGVMLTPLYQLDPFILTLVVIQAYAAALVGRLVSMPLTLLGSVAFGLLSAALTTYFPNFPPPIKQGIPYLLIFALLFTQKAESALDASRRRSSSVI
jgi:branched-subunit amino acid ABC-type transport system permease component